MTQATTCGNGFEHVITYTRECVHISLWGGVPAGHIYPGRPVNCGGMGTVGRHQSGRSRVRVRVVEEERERDREREREKTKSKKSIRF